MSINDLLAFATEARVRDRVHDAWSRLDDDLAARTGLAAAKSGWPCAAYRQADGADAPLCSTEYYINRAFAAVGRLLQRHTGPIFPLIEDLFGVSVVEVHQEIAAVLISPTRADGLKIEAGTAALEMQRTYKTSDGEVAQVTVNTHPASRFRHSMTMRRVKEARSGRRASHADAYRRGLWVHERSPTRSRRRRAPDRTVLVDGDIRPRLRSPARAGDGAGPSAAGTDAGGQRGVVHAAELARSRRHLPGSDAGGHGGQPDPAVAAGPRAAVHPRRRRQRDDLRADDVPAGTTTSRCWTG